MCYSALLDGAAAAWYGMGWLAGWLGPVTQVDRYKQLLLKQRDIMIALTQRLVERDEQIMALQDELDAYDR